jgi:tetratricopeptide (TPR) repeat protein
MRYSFVCDHWAYLSSLVLLAPGVALLAHLAGLLKPKRPWLEAIVCLGLLLTLGGLTWKQAHIYVDQETLWRETLAKNPASCLAQNNLGGTFFDRGQMDEAVSQFKKAMKLKPDYAEPHYNFGLILRKQGRTDEAIREYQEALRLNPRYIQAHNNLGFAFYTQGRFYEAIREYQEALRLKPDYPEAHNNFGIALAQQGRLDEAVGQFHAALGLNPDYAEARDNLARALAMKNAPASR